ncbi:hypothetical protein ACRC7T_16055 [Segnochrobactraceae bacterium EtOH-i3]
MKVVFNARQMSLGGTEIAIYDYARANQEILGNESLVLYNATSPANIPEVIEKFRGLCEVLPYDNVRAVDQIIRRRGGDVFHALKSGFPDGGIAFDVPTAVHAVFPTDPSDAHGTRFAYVSEWLSQECSGGTIPFVPHIVDLPQPTGSLRPALGIPADALVIGLYGSRTSFDVPDAADGLLAALERRPDLWVLNLALARAPAHPRVLTLKGSADLGFKANFIETCDALLHARSLGESFGLACGEFSLRNRPVLTWGGSPHRCHLQILGDRALVWNDAAGLTRLLLGLDRREIAAGDWDCYSRAFSPQAVMETFRRVFLDDVTRDFVRPALTERLRARYRAWRDR